MTLSLRDDEWQTEGVCSISDLHWLLIAFKKATLKPASALHLSPAAWEQVQHMAFQVTYVGGHKPSESETEDVAIGGTRMVRRLMGVEVLRSETGETWVS